MGGNARALTPSPPPLPFAADWLWGSSAGGSQWEGGGAGEV